MLVSLSVWMYSVNDPPLANKNVAVPLIWEDVPPLHVAC
jgi:hypothetical protein